MQSALKSLKIKEYVLLWSCLMQNYNSGNDVLFIDMPLVYKTIIQIYIYM